MATMLLTTVFLLTAAIAMITTVLCVVATYENTLQPSTVNPFSSSVVRDASADTLPLSNACATTLAGDWHTAELATLTQVTDLMDWLENHSITTTELTSMNGKFLVRWR
jgi:hypothetical protein